MDLWHSHLTEAKYPPPSSTVGALSGPDRKFCVEPCGSAAGFDLLTIELVQIEKKSLLASRTANDFVQQDLARTHAARDSGPGPSDHVAALGSTEAGGRHENNFN